jgi:hypothetical protein
LAGTCTSEALTVQLLTITVLVLLYSAFFDASNSAQNKQESQQVLQAQALA